MSQKAIDDSLAIAYGTKKVGLKIYNFRMPATLISIAQKTTDLARE